MNSQAHLMQRMVSREDVKNWFAMLFNAAWSLDHKAIAGILPGPAIPLYGDKVAAMETFCRLLWGIFPLLSHPDEHSATVAPVFRIIANGTNPEHQHYWGTPGDFDQRCVEMAVFGAGLCLAEKAFRSHLSAREFTNLANWLRKIHCVKLPQNNWSFFPIMVETGLCMAGEEWHPEIIEHHFKLLDSYYLGDGWYSDGKDRPRDYYNAMALHYYGLLYAKFMAKHDAHRCAILRERATLFAHDFIHMFNADGSAIPFGRSLTYRFAQSAFWSAVAFADLPVFSSGVVKGLLLRNLNWWRQQDFLDSRGVMNVGFTYDNQVIAEDYNAPGSSYWACKTFIVLALTEKDDFWKNEELPYPEIARHHTFIHAGQIIHHDLLNKHHYLLNGGQFPAKNYNNSESKYTKFAYSSLLGFNLERSRYGLELNACDSMLLFSEDEGYFRGKRVNTAMEIAASYIHFDWNPLTDVFVQTWLVPLTSGHLRLHVIDSNRDIDTVEGGFALPVPTTAVARPGEKINYIINEEKNLFTWIKDVSPVISREAEIVISPPASNLIYPCSSGVVTLQKKICAGRSILCCLVQAGKGVPQQLDTIVNINDRTAIIQMPITTLTLNFKNPIAR